MIEDVIDDECPASISNTTLVGVRMKYSLRDIMLVMLVFGLLLAWMLDRRNMDVERDQLLNEYNEKERAMLVTKSLLEKEREQLRRENVKRRMAENGWLSN